MDPAGNKTFKRISFENAIDNRAVKSKVLQVFIENKLDEAKENLKKLGLKFEKADFFSADDNGYVAAFLRETWIIDGIFEKIVDLIHENGEKLSADDFTAQNGSLNSPLSSALGVRKLDKVFTPRAWVNNTEEMEKLWDVLPEKYKKEIDLATLKLQVEALSTPQFDLGTLSRKSQLFKPVGNGGKFWGFLKRKSAGGIAPLEDYRVMAQLPDIIAILEEIGDPLFQEAFLATHPITSETTKEDIFNPPQGNESPLQVKRGWEQLQELAETFAQKGEPITKSDLLRHASDGSTYMQMAIDVGAASEAFAILKAAGERLDKSEFLENTGRYRSIIESLADKKQLELAFSPDHWVNDVRGMQEVWARVPKIDQKQLDGNEGRPSFKKLLQEANAASIKSLQLGGRRIAE